MKKEQNCQQCGIHFVSYNPNPKYCSKKCRIDADTFFVNFEKAKQLYISGLTQKEVGIKLGASQKQIHKLFKRNKYIPTSINRNQCKENNNNWKGKDVGYDAFHMRVIAERGKPKKCEICGEDNPKVWYDWANLTSNFNDIKDYKRMCRKCHCQYDTKRGLRPQNKKGGK